MARGILYKIAHGTDVPVSGCRPQEGPAISIVQVEEHAAEAQEQRHAATSDQRPVLSAMLLLQRPLLARLGTTLSA
jgi:hypothetical protein